MQACKCAKAESCLRSICVCDVCELQRIRKDAAVILYIWVKIVSCFCSVRICDACKLIRKSINWSIYCVALMCMYAKAESCLCNVYVYDVYELQRVRKDVAVILCIWAKTVSCLCNVCDCDACKLIRKSINWLIYCIALMCMCAKAESCLCSIYVYIVYEFNVWIKRFYCSVCDCTACESIWKCEKSIDLLHHVCSYVHQSWVMPSQYICICCIWVAACMQRRCCSSVYMQASTCRWLRCYCLTFRLCVSSMHEYSAVTVLSMLMRLFSSFNKHSLQKICSQHLIQINLIVDLINKCYANKSWNFVNKNMIKSKVQELCNLNS